MGNIKSCCLQLCPPNKEIEDPYNERTRILNDPTDGRNSEENFQVASSNDRVYGTMEYDEKNNQNNKWNRTLQKMTVNVIDVSTAYIPAMEQSELLERQKAYSNKILISKILFLLKNRQNRIKRLQKKATLDIKKLQIPDIVIVEDMNFMNKLTDKISEAVNKGFLIKMEEDLVVQFNP